MIRVEHKSQRIYLYFCASNECLRACAHAIISTDINISIAYTTTPRGFELVRIVCIGSNRMLYLQICNTQAAQKTIVFRSIVISSTSNFHKQFNLVGWMRLHCALTYFRFWYLIRNHSAIYKVWACAQRIRGKQIFLFIRNLRFSVRASLS